MKKTLVFDMDGTLCDFYNVNGWLDYLNAENAYPYEVAEPLYDMEELGNLLHCFQLLGWEIVVTSWLAKNSSEEFKNRTRQAKREWLEMFNFPFDEIHLVQYGTTKANCTRKKGGYQILVDDNEIVRRGWHLGGTVDANNNILAELHKILMTIQSKCTNLKNFSKSC